MSQESSDSEQISVELGDRADDSTRGGLFSTKDKELTGVLTICDDDEHRNISCDELSMSETGVDIIFWIELQSADEFDCISVVHELTSETVFDEVSDDTFSCIDKCSHVLRKSIKLPDRMFVPNWFK